MKKGYAIITILLTVLAGMIYFGYLMGLPITNNVDPLHAFVIVITLLFFALVSLREALKF